MNKTIIIMAKVPIAGSVKTRLQPFLTPEQSVALAKCFLQDTLNKLGCLKIQLIIAFSPIEKRIDLQNILTNELILIEQKGTNLGEKMFRAFEFAFSKNSDAVVMIGTDSPTFPAEFIERAFEKLTNEDAVLGKTSDGGFYLIGLRKIEQKIFENVRWSSPETFEQTKRNIESLYLSLGEIPGWYDVDTPEDLNLLAKELSEYPHRAPKTSEFLNGLRLF